MTPAMRRYQHAALQERIARAQLLLQLAGADRGACLADVLTFAHQIGDETAADSVAAFRVAQLEQLQTAESELNRLAAPSIRDENTKGNLP